MIAFGVVGAFWLSVLLAWYHLQPIDSFMGEVYWRVPAELCFSQLHIEIDLLIMH
jgi:hypothetical protein